MKLLLTNSFISTSHRRQSTTAGARTAVLLLVVFLMGLGAGAFWIYRDSQSKRAATTDNTPQPSLSARTKSVLNGVDSNVEIRFYSILNDPNVRDSSAAFAERVELLLAEYEREGGRRIRVTKLDSGEEATMKAASADSITPFNLEKGDPCYLGIAVISEERKESIARLSAEWEEALEMDLTRIIARVSSPAPAAPPSATTTPVNAAISGQITQLIPDMKSVSLEDGRNILREAALKEFTETAKEMQAKVKQAEDRFRQLSDSGRPESELKTALDELRKIQSEQAEKLTEIATRSQERISAFEQIKGGTK